MISPIRRRDVCYVRRYDEGRKGVPTIIAIDKSPEIYVSLLLVLYEILKPILRTRAHACIVVKEDVIGPIVFFLFFFFFFSLHLQNALSNEIIHDS